MPSTLLAVVASVFVTAAAAQAEPDVPHDGPWLATIRPDDGGPQTARFVLRGFTGEWTGAGGKSPVTRSTCAGRKLPITVQASTAGALEFTVWGTQVSAKCADLTVELRAVGEDVFEGQAVSVGTVRVARR